jgi:hypothetical protein
VPNQRDCCICSTSVARRPRCWAHGHGRTVRRAPFRVGGARNVLELLGARATRGEPLCATCRRITSSARCGAGLASGIRVWAPVAYSGAARDLVRALKFRGAIALGGRDGRADRRERPAGRPEPASAGLHSRSRPVTSAAAALARLQPGGGDRGRDRRPRGTAVCALPLPVGPGPSPRSGAIGRERRAGPRARSTSPVRCPSGSSGRRCGHDGRHSRCVPGRSRRARRARCGGDRVRSHDWSLRLDPPRRIHGPTSQEVRCASS